MGSAIQAALKAGLAEAEFWGLTPYRLNQRLSEIHRARHEAQLMAGWWAERFSREQTLRGPQAYIEEMLDGSQNPLIGEEMAEAELTRWAMQWGLPVDDIEEGSVAGVDGPDHG